MPTPIKKPPEDADQAPPAPPGDGFAADIDGALFQAQTAITSVGKDSFNAYDRYRYTSADEMMAAAREGLRTAGLYIHRDRYRMDYSAIEQGLPGAVPELVSHCVLSMPSRGERREYEWSWPVVVNPTRAFAVDKARGGALTTSWNYFLRDLLNIPRSTDDPNEEHMDSRPDRDREPPPQDRRAPTATAAAKTEIAELTGLISRMKSPVYAKTASTYLARAGFDAKLLRQVRNWVDEHLELPDPPPKDVPVVPGKATPDDALRTDDPVDPESPLFDGFDQGNDGP